jgi:hypothetical protein
MTEARPMYLPQGPEEFWELSAQGQSLAVLVSGTLRAFQSGLTDLEQWQKQSSDGGEEKPPRAKDTLGLGEGTAGSPSSPPGIGATADHSCLLPPGHSQKPATPGGSGQSHWSTCRGTKRSGM